MRLLCTQTLRLSEFFDQTVPSYAILSHTWDREEVSFQDMQNLDNARRKLGFAKIDGACELAASRGYEFIWIDTCCIDKTSSAELSEAINSMYSWYKKASDCFAYLVDVEFFETSGVNAAGPRITLPLNDRIAKSRWFTRGWTLQELIAPDDVKFFSKEWVPLGTKFALRDIISKITGIDMPILAGGDPREMCIARKMFWASRRQTTRVEDIAYCLMGIFGVNMPLIYGEGKKAFIRLQEEIIKIHDDHSIFAWVSPEVSRLTASGTSGLLASHPSYFEETGKNLWPFPQQLFQRQPTKLTSNGLEVQVQFVFRDDQEDAEIQKDSYSRVIGSSPIITAALDCQLNNNSLPCVLLESSKHPVEQGPQQFRRVLPHLLPREKIENTITYLESNGEGLSSSQAKLEKAEWKSQSIFVPHHDDVYKPLLEPYLGFRISIPDKSIRIIGAYPVRGWFQHDNMFRRLRSVSVPESLDLSFESGQTHLLLLNEMDESKQRLFFRTREFEGMLQLEIQNPVTTSQAQHAAVLFGIRKSDKEYQSRVCFVSPWCFLIDIESDQKLDHINIMKSIPKYVSHTSTIPAIGAGILNATVRKFDPHRKTFEIEVTRSDK